MDGKTSSSYFVNPPVEWGQWYANHRYMVGCYVRFFVRYRRGIGDVRRPYSRHLPGPSWSPSWSHRQELKPYDTVSHFKITWHGHVCGAQQPSKWSTQRSSIKEPPAVGIKFSQMLPWWTNNSALSTNIWEIVKKVVLSYPVKQQSSYEPDFTELARVSAKLAYLIMLFILELPAVQAI